MTNPRSLAVAQSCPARGDVPANLAEHLRLVAVAAAEGAGLVVFPELSLTGYELGLAGELAFSEADARLAPLVDAAASARASLVVGAPVRLGEQLHIGAFVLRPDGRIALYTKHRLGAFSTGAAVDGTVPPPESSVFAPGERNAPVAFGGGAAAVAICADIGDPAHVRRAAGSGARAYLASMFVIPSEFEGDAARLAGYAVEHAMVVGLANYGSPTGGLQAAGRSSIWSESGELLARLDPSGPGVAVATATGNGWRAKTIMLDRPAPLPA
jgi:predicted amidohydrolase